MKFEIKNRYTGDVQFTAEVDCDEGVSQSVKFGLAVQWAIDNNANLTSANLAYANLTSANLADANLARANLTSANLTDANLTGADLTGADLTGADLTGANLADADLAGANLAGANLAGANLTGADLTGANLAYANLTSADLARAYLAGLTIPKVKNIHQCVYEAASKPDALDMKNWHTCDTTHCRAGWVVTLAGGAGREIERLVGTGVAAAMIYKESDPNFTKVPNWAASNADALADMKRLAVAEANNTSVSTD